MAATTVTDAVALAVGADGARLWGRGTVRLRGYVLVTKAYLSTATGTPLVMGAPDSVDTLRVYSSTSFDRWVEVAKSAVVHQMPNRAEDDGRSLVWVDANAVVTVGHAVLAANVGPSMEVTDEPTTYPPWPP